MQNAITVQFVEGNANGRIFKTREMVPVTRYQSREVLAFVVQHPSRLVPGAPIREKGRFTGKRQIVPTRCEAGEPATGWMLGGTFPALYMAREALGINTAPKRPAAVAAALKLAA